MNTYKGPHKHANDPDRRKWLKPEVILSDIDLKLGFTFMDIGCGGGFFALPAARVVGESGKVYGVDIDAKSISELEELASREALHNLDLVVGRAEDVVLCESCADIAFFGEVLHDFEDPARVLQNVKKMLKPVGRIVNLDWKKVNMQLGPPLVKRFSEEEASRLITAAGFRLVSIKDVVYYYLMVAKL